MDEVKLPGIRRTDSQLSIQKSSEAESSELKSPIAWRLAEEMKIRSISKARMAYLLRTSRTQVDRLLSPTDDITLNSLQRAAAVMGLEVNIALAKPIPVTPQVSTEQEGLLT
jgi:hypothetical protein